MIDPLVFSATARCPCGAGLAHEPDRDSWGHPEPWLCSAVIRGTSDKELRHSYAASGGVASETHPSAAGRNTRDLAPRLQVITGTGVEHG